MSSIEQRIAHAEAGLAEAFAYIDNMEETTSVLALGAGGISKCVMRQEEKIQRAPNIANIEQYIARVDEMVERKREAFAEKASRIANNQKGE